MSHSKTLGTILGRTFQAISGKSLYARDEAADIFAILLEYHGLALVSTSGFVVEWDEDGDVVSVVTSDDAGAISVPPLDMPLSADRAHALGAALIAMAHDVRSRD